MVHSLLDVTPLDGSDLAPLEGNRVATDVKKPRRRTAPVRQTAADPAGPRSRPVQVSAAAYEAVSKVCEQTDISRAQIIDYLLTKFTVKEMVSMLKGDAVKRRPVGKPKRRFFD